MSLCFKFKLDFFSHVQNNVGRSLCMLLASKDEKFTNSSQLEENLTYSLSGSRDIFLELILLILHVTLQK
jgi:hypothetical protein